MFGAITTAISAGTNIRYETATKVQSDAYTAITVDRLQNFRRNMSLLNVHKT